MTMEETPQRPMPKGLRWFMRIGKYFGYVWVPENYVQVYYKWTRYAGVKTPSRHGLIRYNGFTETLGQQIDVGPRMKRYLVKGLMTRDILPVTIDLHALVCFDPTAPKALPDVIRILVELPQKIYPDIAETYYRWVLQLLVSRYNATELMLGEIRAQIENEIKENVAQEMVFLGLKPAGKPRIMDVQIPSSLKERHELIAQRRASILAGTEFHPAEFRRALMTEFMESIARRGVGDSILNFQEMFEAYVAERKDRLPSRIIDHPPIQPGNSQTPPDDERPKSQFAGNL